MRTVAALSITLDVCTDLVEHITTAQLRLATPCPGWSVRDVIEHSIAVTSKFTAFAAGATDRPRTPESHVGTDHAAAFRAAATASAAAWATADAARTCRLPFGSYPAELAAGINLFDVLGHASDIEAATGEPFGCPDDVWATGLWAARQVIGDNRDPRHYAPALPPPGPHPTFRSVFLAYLGRGPRR